MQVVERRRKQATEGVEPRLPARLASGQAAGRSGTSGRDESGMDLLRATLPQNSTPFMSQAIRMTWGTVRSGRNRAMRQDFVASRSTMISV